MTSALALPLAFDGRGRFARATGSRALAARVGTLLDTLPGEVEMAPELGSKYRLRRYEPDDELLAADLRDDAAEAVARWEPTLRLDGVSVAHAGHGTAVTARFRSRFTGEAEEATTTM